MGKQKSLDPKKATKEEKKPMPKMKKNMSKKACK